MKIPSQLSPASIAVLFGLISGSLSGVPVQWTVGSGGNGHYYDVISTPNGITWTAAQAAAIAAGGYLATITSAGENAFAFNLANNPLYWFNDPLGNSEGPWLGGLQPVGLSEPASGWQWVNGEGPFVFTAWAPAQPDNFNGAEDRLLDFAPAPNTRSSGWNDGPSTALTGGYVIEFNSAPGVPDAANSALLLFGALTGIAALRKKLASS